MNMTNTGLSMYSLGSISFVVSKTFYHFCTESYVTMLTSNTNFVGDIFDLISIQWFNKKRMFTLFPTGFTLFPLGFYVKLCPCW